MASRALRICFVAPHAYPVLAGNSGIRFMGGAELQQVLVARGLAARGHSVSMVCLDFGQQDEVRIDGITVHRAFRPNAGLPVLRFVVPRLTSLWRAMQRAGADIYYQRTASMLTGVTTLFAQRHGKRSVFAVAGAPKIRFSRDRYLYHYGVRHTDCIVVQNALQAREIREAAGRDTVLIPNAYQMEPTPPAPGAGDCVLWVGMLRNVKRPELFLDLAESLPHRHFVMIGGEASGEPRVYRDVARRAASLGNLEFTGFVPYAEVGAYFDRAQVLVSTSETEGFPNTFLQAWARGVPSVAFVDSGARYEGSPVGVQVSSLAEMTQAVDALAGDEEERCRLGDRCRAYVEREHALPRVLDLYEALFERILEPAAAVAVGRP